jgi:hypothetical protein
MMDVVARTHPWLTGVVCAVAISGCASSPPTTYRCEPHSVGWAAGIRIAPADAQESAKRLEIPAGKCGLYFYSEAWWQNSPFTFDRVWAVAQNSGVESVRFMTDEQAIFAVWYLEPGPYRVHVEAMGWQGPVTDDAALDVKCPPGGAVFVADTHNGASLKLVDSGTGRDKIQSRYLSAGDRRYHSYACCWWKCLPPDTIPPIR